MQQLIARLFGRLMKSWSWVLLIVFTILIKWVSWYPGWVERNYSQGVYPVISKVQRLLFGWLPFSIGDLFYGFLILVIIYKTFSFFQTAFSKKTDPEIFCGSTATSHFLFSFHLCFLQYAVGIEL